MNKSIWRLASRRLQVYCGPAHSGTHVGEGPIDGTFGQTDALAELFEERAVESSDFSIRAIDGEQRIFPKVYLLSFPTSVIMGYISYPSHKSGSIGNYKFLIWCEISK